MGYVNTTAGMTAEDVDRGRGPIAENPGRYRAKIVAVKDHTDDESPSVLLTMSVTGSDRGQSPVGSTLFHRVYFTDKTIKMAAKFYLRTELLHKDESGRLIDSRGIEQIDSDELAELEGVEICAEWNAESYTKQDGSEVSSLKIPYSEVWLATDPVVSEWPCNKSNSSKPSDSNDDYDDV